MQRGNRLPAAAKGNASHGGPPWRATKPGKGAQQLAARDEEAAQRQVYQQQRKRGPPDVDAGAVEPAAARTHKVYWSMQDKARYIRVLQEHGKDMDCLAAAFPDRRGPPC